MTHGKLFLVFNLLIGWQDVEFYYYYDENGLREGSLVDFMLIAIS
jgi:hypothetical protein